MVKSLPHVILVVFGGALLAFAPSHPASAETFIATAPATPTTSAGEAPAAAAGNVVPALAEDVSLRPGAFVWRPEQAPMGAVEIVVSIPQQRAYVYRGGALIGVTTVSTGRKGHPTPIGTFDILEKRREHYSNLYNNAPMPFMQRLTWDGIALHAGEIPGRPASHGCVRLPLAFARHLFGVTKVGATVRILDVAPVPREVLANVVGADAYAGMGGPEEDIADLGPSPAAAAPAPQAPSAETPAPVSALDAPAEPEAPVAASILPLASAGSALGAPLLALGAAFGRRRLRRIAPRGAPATGIGSEL
jgi:lipoprotein-anchoring transpeptidase ErfK/SrfK